jgi:hypothetical protein
VCAADPKSGSFLLIAHGDQPEVQKAKSLLVSSSPTGPEKYAVQAASSNLPGSYVD